MTAITTVVSSPSYKKGRLQGPRRQALKVSSSLPPSNRPSTKKSSAAPVIVYEHTPKVVHTRPHEFMAIVQSLTGKPPVSLQAPLSSDDVHVALAEERSGGGDPLLLAAGQIMSPGGFFFSPNTVQLIQ
ncbi:unnamed protein product [Alopecurus aequalis]